MRQKKEGVVMTLVPRPEMGVQVATKCKCYTSAMKNPARYIRDPTRIIMHSTGANNPMLKRYVGPDDGVPSKNSAGITGTERPTLARGPMPLSARLRTAG